MMLPFVFEKEHMQNLYVSQSSFWYSFVEQETKKALSSLNKEDSLKRFLWQLCLERKKKTARNFKKFLKN